MESTFMAAGVEAVMNEFFDDVLNVAGKIDPFELQLRAESEACRKVSLVCHDLCVSSSSAEQINRDAKAAMSTVVLKIQLHCRGCVLRIRRCIAKIEGVESISFDWSEEQVTVNGTMDVDSLLNMLKRKMRRKVDIASKAKDDDEEVEDNEIINLMDRIEFPSDGDKSQIHACPIELVQPPIIFSDENPNSCAVF
ncbi:heavy metal-associated isoprenylated plant protein 19-like [Wolffia australiana]